MRSRCRVEIGVVAGDDTAFGIAAFVAYARGHHDTRARRVPTPIPPRRPTRRSAAPRLPVFAPNTSVKAAYFLGRCRSSPRRSGSGLDGSRFASIQRLCSGEGSASVQGNSRR